MDRLTPDYDFSLRAEEGTLQRALRNNYTPLQGFCIMLFCLLTVPCVATMAVVRRESNSWKFMFGQILLFTVIAYTITFIVFQTGSILNIGTSIVPPKEIAVVETAGLEAE